MGDNAGCPSAGETRGRDGVEPSAFAGESAAGRGRATLVVGLSGWGKSAYLAWLLAQERRWLLWAPWDEGFTSGALAHSYRDFLALWERTKGLPICRIRYNPPLWDSEACEALLSDFATRLFRSGRNVTWALDEAARFRARKGAEFPKSFYRILSEGRHHNVSTVLVTQQPVGIPKDARSLADSCVSFRLADSEEIRRLRLFYGDRAEEIAELPKFHSLRYTAGVGVEACGPIVLR